MCNTWSNTAAAAQALLSVYSVGATLQQCTTVFLAIKDPVRRKANRYVTQKTKAQACGIHVNSGLSRPRLLTGKHSSHYTSQLK